jgi:chromosome segregation ATPase
LLESSHKAEVEKQEVLENMRSKESEISQRIEQISALESELSSIKSLLNSSISLTQNLEQQILQEKSEISNLKIQHENHVTQLNGKQSLDMEAREQLLNTIKLQLSASQDDSQNREILSNSQLKMAQESFEQERIENSRILNLLRIEMESNEKQFKGYEKSLQNQVKSLQDALDQERAVTEKSMSSQNTLENEVKQAKIQLENLKNLNLAQEKSLNEYKVRQSQLEIELESEKEVCKELRKDVKEKIEKEVEDKKIMGMEFEGRMKVKDF